MMEHLLPDHVRYPAPQMYREGTPLYLDFETTNLDSGSALNPNNRLVLACWKLEDGPIRHKWGSEYEQEELLEAIAAADYIVAHNAKFELQWLVRCGLDLTKVVVYDTMIAEYVIGGNRYRFNQLGLERCLIRHGLEGKEAVVSKMIKAGICPSEIPEQWLLKYCRRDVAALPQLMRKQIEAMHGTRLLPVVYNRCLLTPVLADIEAEGMQLDPEKVSCTYKDLKARHEALTQRMNLLTGGIKATERQKIAEFLYDRLGFSEVMVKKGREWVPKRTPGGARCTDADTMAMLTARTPEQREFLDLYVEINDVGQRLSKYFNKFYDCCTQAGGVLYANFNQTATQTHRLSSTGREYSAQFQNFPREYKHIFKARRPGYLMGEADGAQLEFRVAAHLGRDSSALGDIEANVDVHTFTSEVLTRAGQPTDRQGAKTHTFKPLTLAA